MTVFTVDCIWVNLEPIELWIGWIKCDFIAYRSRKVKMKLNSKTSQTNQYPGILIVQYCSVPILNN